MFKLHWNDIKKTSPASHSINSPWIQVYEIEDFLEEICIFKTPPEQIVPVSFERACLLCSWSQNGWSVASFMSK